VPAANGALHGVGWQRVFDGTIALEASNSQHERIRKAGKSARYDAIKRMPT
jgi:hypothetical protein